MNDYKRNHVFQVSHIPILPTLFVYRLYFWLHMKMDQVKSLKNLALLAVPCPDQAAELYLPSCHPMYVALQERAYKEMRTRYQQEHKEKFRSVLRSLKNLPSCPYTSWSFHFEEFRISMCPYCDRMFREERSIDLRIVLNKPPEFQSLYNVGNEEFELVPIWTPFCLIYRISLENVEGLPVCHLTGWVSTEPNCEHCKRVCDENRMIDHRFIIEKLCKIMGYELKGPLLLLVNQSCLQEINARYTSMFF